MSYLVQFPIVPALSITPEVWVAGAAVRLTAAACHLADLVDSNARWFEGDG